MESDDPYNFTIQQTIDTLSPLLDESHKLSFRSNEITGRVLLNTASFKTLKEELAVIPLGRREGIMAIVKQLRQQSPLYQENLQSIAVATPLPSDEEEERLIGCLELAYQPNVAGKKRKRKRDEQPPGDILEGWVELPCTERFEKPDMVPAMGEPATEQRLDSPAREPALELWNRDGPLIVRNPWGEENATASWVDRYGVLRDSKFSGSEEENEHSISGLCVETKPQDLNQSVLQCESGDEEFYSPVESVDVGPKRIAPTNIGPVMEEMEAGETSPDGKCLLSCVYKLAGADFNISRRKPYSSGIHRTFRRRRNFFCR